MKPLFLFLFICVTLTSFGQKVRFENFKSWELAKKNAKANNKKIFLYFGATWCAPCNQIKKKILPDSGVQKKLDANFIRYEFDVDQASSIPFLKKYRISSVPLILVLNSDGFVTNRFSDIPMEIDGFNSMLVEAATSQEYIKGVSNSLKLNTPKFYDDYFDNGMKQLPDSVIVEEYLKAQTDLTTETNWNVLTYFNTNDSYFYFIKENENRLFNLYGMEVKFKKLDMYRRIAEKYIQAKDSTKYNHIASLLTGADNPNDAKGQEAYLFRQLLFLGRTGMDWDKFVNISRLCIDRYGSSKIHFICQYALASKPNSAATRFLIDVMTPVVNDKPNPNLFFMYGALLWYSGKTNTADHYFQKALSGASDEKQSEFFKEKIETIRKS